MGAATDVRFYNNIFFASGGSTAGDAYLASLQGDATFINNDYWVDNGAYWGIYVNSNSYLSLSSFQAAGYEQIGATMTGFSVNPNLVNPGRGGTLGNPNNLATLTAYRLQPGSPMVDAAQSVATLTGAFAGWRDYYNGELCFNAACDVGAHEYGAVQETTGVAGNLFANPGFESGLTNWVVYHTAPVVSTTTVRTGSRAALFVPGNSFTDLAQEIENLGAGAYEATGWVYGDGLDTGYLFAFDSNINGHVPLNSSSNANNLDAGWYQLVVDFTLSGTGSQTASFGYLYADIAAGSPGVFYDDMRLVQLPDPEATNGMNLLGNSGFEEAAFMWGQAGTGGNVVATNSARSGASALEFTGTTASSFTQTLDGLGAGDYRATVWQYGDGITIPVVTLFDAGGSAITSTSGLAASGWHLLSLAFSLSGSGSQTGIGFALSVPASNAPMAVIFDDAALTQE